MKTKNSQQTFTYSRYDCQWKQIRRNVDKTGEDQENKETLRKYTEKGFWNEYKMYGLSYKDI